MTFIRPIEPELATGTLAEAYERDPYSGQPGSIVRAWSQRPDALRATMALSKTLGANLDERRAELIRVIASSLAGCSICSLQHGATLLRSGDFTTEQLEELVTDSGRADLDATDEAIATFVTKVVQEPHRVDPSDVETLRTCGLDDGEIFDIVVWAQYCIFWAGVHDAIGYEPHPKWVGETRTLLGEGLWNVLSVGRHFGSDE